MSQIFHIYLIPILMVSVNKSWAGFCESEESISNAYSIGNYVYISQGIHTIWKYNVKSNTFADSIQTIENIFGTSQFETVDTAFAFDFKPCFSDNNYCHLINKTKNIVIVIREKYDDLDLDYGYSVYKLYGNNELKPVPKDYANEWGLDSTEKFNGNFWLKGNNFIYVGIALENTKNIIYVIINEINDQLTDTSHYLLFTRKLDNNGVWSEWNRFKINRLNGIFSINGFVYGVDVNDYILSVEMINEDLHIKPISTAKEFFHCQQISTTVMSYLKVEQRANPRQSDPDYVYTGGIFEGNQTSSESTKSESVEVQTESESSKGTTLTVITHSVKESEGEVSETSIDSFETTNDYNVDYIPKPSGSQENPSDSGGSVGLWILLLILVLIFLAMLVLIAMLYSIKNSRNKPNHQNSSEKSLKTSTAKSGVKIDSIEGNKRFKPSEKSVPKPVTKSEIRKESKPKPITETKSENKPELKQNSIRESKVKAKPELNSESKQESVPSRGSEENTGVEKSSSNESISSVTSLDN